MKERDSPRWHGFVELRFKDQRVFGCPVVTVEAEVYEEIELASGHLAEAWPMLEGWWYVFVKH